MTVIVLDRPITLNVTHSVELAPECPVLVRAHARRRPTRIVAELRAERETQLRERIRVAREVLHLTEVAGMPNGYALAAVRTACMDLASFVYGLARGTIESRALVSAYAPECAY
jgi:hypothetical protein